MKNEEELVSMGIAVQRELTATLLRNTEVAPVQAVIAHPRHSPWRGLQRQTSHSARLSKPYPAGMASHL